MSVVTANTLAQLIKSAIDNLNSKMVFGKVIATSKSQIEVGCVRIEVCIKRLLRKLLKFSKDGFKAEVTDVSIVPVDGKWRIILKLVLKKCDIVRPKVSRIESVHLEEERKGWKLDISYI